MYCTITGYGFTGPMAAERAYDPIMQARSGFASMQGNDDFGRPMMIRTIIADNATALTAAQGITAALFKRERTGQGEHVRIAMLDASVAFLWPEAFARQTMMDAPGANEPQHYTRDIIYTTKDKQYIVAGTNTESEWLGLCRALESVNPGLAEDPRFLTGALRSKNVQERYETVDEAIGHFDQADVLARLQAEDVPSSPVNHPRSQVFDDPQVRANELLFETEHPSAGRLLQPRGAAEFVSSPFQLRHHAPQHGESTREVLAEILPDAEASGELDKLEESGVVSQLRLGEPKL